MKLLSLIATLAFAVSALAAEPKVIKIDGSSTVYPITEALAEEFQLAQKGAVKITAAFSGTGGGFKKFCRNEIEVTGASRPISQSELENCRKTKVKFYELPIAFDATVVVVHPSNPLTQITVEELKKMWAPESQGKIKTWSDVNAAWPKTTLKLYGAGADSGTFDYFTEAIVGKSKSSRGDYTASEDDNILVKGVGGDKSALGYVPLAYYLENSKKIKALAIVNKQGKAVLPTKENVENASYNPLARPLFFYVNAEAAKRPEVKDFVAMMLTTAGVIVPEVKFVALPKKAYDQAQEHFKKGKLGTVFDGHAGIGMTIDELLKKESSL